MKYTKFLIKNYKGIEDLQIDLDIIPDNKTYTLIGLNESGKTTILEAINDFDIEVPDSEKYKLVLKRFAGGFTGEVFISATISFTDEDKEKIKQFIKDKIPKCYQVDIKNSFVFERKYIFDNANFKSTSKTYTQFLTYKKTKDGKDLNLEKVVADNLWVFIKKDLFPEIIFYRDFLSKFPEKIYLEAESNDTKGREYKSIIDDILVSINPTYNIEKSLLERLRNPTPSNSQSLEAVENEISAQITQKINEAWAKLQKVNKKDIVVKTGFEEDSNGNKKYYIKLNVKDGIRSFSISERSLGFRWFFTFLLYTEFRKERIQNSGEILFLLDEPASNLHQSAQKSLLDTFRQITEKSRLIYTTHSHFLINPEWLNTTYVIKNEGLKYGSNDYDFQAKDTKIEAYKYKQFVSEHPNQTDYFRPILDVLDYQPGLLEMIPKIVITEGKFDFFTFKYFKEIVINNNDNFNFYPGHSATKLDLPIGIYESWAKQYLVILDSDKEGETQKSRYIKEISDQTKIFTLEDINTQFKNISTENLFSEEERIKISQEFNLKLQTFEKPAFNTGIQLLFSERRIPEYISENTKKNFKTIFDFITSKFL